MKLLAEDIKNIDAWLKRKGIKYVDVRYELIDHLVTEYESIENYPDLSSFLEERKAWCKKIAKEKQKAANFAMTRGVFKKAFGLLTNFKSFGIILLAILALYTISLNVSAEVFDYILFGILVLPILVQFYFMIYSGLGKSLRKEALSAVFLGNIFVLPQVFVHFFNLIPNTIIGGFNIMILYVFLGVLINVAAILFFLEKRKQLLKELALLKQVIT